MKFCRYCRNVLPLSDFAVRKASADGLAFKCRKCDKAYRDSRGKETYKTLRVKNYQENKDHEKQKALEYYRKNRSACITRHLKYKEDTAEQQKAYRIATRAQINERTRRYTLGKELRTPKGLTSEHIEQIKAVYVERELLEKQSGLPLHVDHVVPLHGKTVSGLHVPWNLQIVPAKYNLSKGNRHAL